MRTTVEISDVNRERLLALAARRGEKGFSRLVDEAVSRLLAEETRREDARRVALALRGTLSARDADELGQRTSQVRTSWR